MREVNNVSLSRQQALHDVLVELNWRDVQKTGSVEHNPPRSSLVYAAAILVAAIEDLDRRAKA